MKKNAKKIFGILLVISFFALGALNASAKTVEEILQNLDNPLGWSYEDPVDLSSSVGDLINYALGVVGTIAIIFFIYGGFQWMTAEGKAEQSSQARMIIMWTAIGLAVIFSSYLIISFIFGAI